MELKDALEDYRLYLNVLQRKSKKTQQSYLHDIEVYLNFLGKRNILLCENISVLDIEDFWMSMPKITLPRVSIV